jgi:hypothetical protein
LNGLEEWQSEIESDDEEVSKFSFAFIDESLSER